MEPAPTNSTNPPPNSTNPLPEHPIITYVRSLIDAAHSNCRPITNLANLFLNQLALQNAIIINRAAIEQIATILSRHEVLWVFQPEDVEALRYLRDERNWTGHAAMVNTGGVNPLYATTRAAIAANNFVGWYATLDCAGDANPYGNIEGFGAHPYGHAMNLAATHQGHQVSLNAGLNAQEVPLNAGHQVPLNAGHQVPLNAGLNAQQVPLNAGHQVPLNAGHQVPLNAGLNAQQVPLNAGHQVPLNAGLNAQQVPLNADPLNPNAANFVGAPNQNNPNTGVRVPTAEFRPVSPPLLRGGPPQFGYLQQSPRPSPPRGDPPRFEYPQRPPPPSPPRGGPGYQCPRRA